MPRDRGKGNNLEDICSERRARGKISRLGYRIGTDKGTPTGSIISRRGNVASIAVSRVCRGARVRSNRSTNHDFRKKPIVGLLGFATGGDWLRGCRSFRVQQEHTLRAFRRGSRNVLSGQSD